MVLGIEMMVETALGDVELGRDALDGRAAITALVDQARRRMQKCLMPGVTTDFALVDRIASELNVTKGSFYHHLDAKDHLVLDCFERSNSRVAIAQRAADAAGGSHWQCLSSIIATLLDVQFRGDFPLLRTAALQAVPSELRGGVIEGSNRIARRFAGTMIDGITEGSIRPVDPLVASQLLVATLNAAYELRKWAGMLEPAEAVRLYASTLTHGLYRDPPG